MSEFVNFDIDLLRQAAKDAGYSLTEVSTEIGKSHGYLSTCGSRNLIDKHYLTLACGIVGAKLSDIIIPEEEIAEDEPSADSNAFYGFSVSLEGTGTGVYASLRYCGDKICEAHAYIREDDFDGILEGINNAIFRLSSAVHQGKWEVKAK